MGCSARRNRRLTVRAPGLGTLRDYQRAWLRGVLAAVGLSVAELLFRVGRPHDAIQGIVPRLAGMHDIDDYPRAKAIPGLVVYRYDAPLFFANAQDFRRRALAAATQASPQPAGSS